MPALATGAPVAGSYNAVTGYELLPMDTSRPTGAAPQSVAVTPFQIAAIAVELIGNTVTSTANAGTLNTLGGKIITEALTTAAGANYTMTLTNSTIAATSTMQVAVYSLTNTIPGLMVFSVVPAAGSAVILIRNNGTLALNGTIVIAFQVSPT